MSIKCRIWFDTQLDAYVVSNPGNEKFVEAMKAFVPSGSREWDPRSRFWYIKEQYIEFVRTLGEKVYGVGAVSFTSKTVAQQSSSQTYRSGSMTTTQSLLAQWAELLPYDAAKRAYLIACQMMHPDKGGDGQKMARLNELWDKVEKEVYRR